MGSSTRSIPKDLTVDGVAEVAYVSSEWEELTLLHTAETAGDLLIAFTGGKVTLASAFLLPRNLVVQFRVEPHVTLTAVSEQGPRRLNLIVTPLPWSGQFLARVCGILERLEQTLAPLLPTAVLQKGARR